MKFKHLLILVLAALNLSTQAQWCDQEYIHQLDPNPAYRQMGLHLDPPERSVWTDKTIPTVVHVLHPGIPYGQASHLTTVQVNSVIDYLNLQLAGEVEDMPNTQIQFCLATLGPQGQSINPIQYHDLNQLDQYAGASTGVYDDLLYYHAELLWDVDDSQYCNIYVMPWAGNPAGFSSLPPGSTGIWMRTDYFIDLESDVLIHEAGHWCGLSHTFNDGSFGYSSCEAALAEEDCQTEGDFVCDTPPTMQNNGCFATCPELEPLLDNHMDYTTGTCRTTLTTGQIDRMHSQLVAGRFQHLENPACNPTTLGLSMEGWYNASEQCQTDQIIPIAVVKNQFDLEFQYIFDLTLKVVLASDTIYTSTITRVETFGPHEEISFEMPEVSLPFGDYLIYFIVDVLDPTLDVWQYDDEFWSDLYVEPSTTLSIDYAYSGSSGVQWKIWEQGAMSNDYTLACGYGNNDCYPFNSNDTLVQLEYCLPDGCYEMRWRFTSSSPSQVLNGCDDQCYVSILTEWGDTLLYWDQAGQFPPNAVNGNIDFEFCIEAQDQSCLDLNADNICDSVQDLGCTDQSACNYDPDATDGDPNVYCDYGPNPGILDCDWLCINDQDQDGVCDEWEIVGCQDPEACNFDPDATDGDPVFWCQYPTEPGIFDCNGDCINDQDQDGVCDEWEIVGCQDPEACNFDPVATDPAWCEFADPGYSCDGIPISSPEDWGTNVIEIDGFDFKIVDRYLYDPTGRRVDPFDRPTPGIYIEVAVLENGRVFIKKVMKFNQ